LKPLSTLAQLTACFPSPSQLRLASISKLDRRSDAAVLENQDVWVHPVVLHVGEHALDIKAAFTKNLPVSGLLGRRGFFEHFKITFDPSSDPPGMELERVLKA
jgi:hypothetical protein